MPMDTVRIAVIGGGRNGAPLIEQFLNTPFVSLVGVADTDPGSPGAVLAKHSGVFFTSDAMLFATRDHDIDVVVEASADPILERRLKDAFSARDNAHTIIVPSLVARLMISMLDNAETLSPPPPQSSESAAG